MPPGVKSDGTVAVPSPVPATEAAPLPPEPFADELPPNFWGDDLLPPADIRAGIEPVDLLESAPSAASRPVEGALEQDPRFVLLTELFPGRITAWQAAVPDAPADRADDAEGAPETVDLGESSDADDAV